ncbi:hypothetical protein G6O69_08555 [Pseudenhygromyxa sp. WMMC2535]|uniref:hypothetical protein n=1 Tax=Pseudenhygromyxa sp. WMMC2535 TaxID=2712867 RepID=UPI001555C49F|nr:hypothetical protein [Pseudenhygromyxa sp. WMMC2535]NVB37883.1 hypothetical protein [Pseudenhygromyxa sp. WMMC2535]
MSRVVIDEIRSLFGGGVPELYQRMAEQGVLEARWPEIRKILVEPAPLPPQVVQALLAILSLRCVNTYCFVYHSLSLVQMDASVIEIDELAQLFSMPAIVPNHERWSRLLKLTWLACREGPHQRAADLRLRKACDFAEYERIMQVCDAGLAINRFNSATPSQLDGDEGIERMPAQLRAMIPNFVHFHARHVSGSAQSRPVSTICSSCQALRSTEDEWYPYDVAAELLDPNTLFSHGLCPACFEDF